MTAHDLMHLTSPASASLGPDTIALIPLGAVEQHGPHLPLGTDTLIAQALARRVAERVALPVVVLPSPVGGLSNHHAAFAGTMTLRESTLTGVLDDLIGSLARSGVSRVGLFSAHGGNFEFLGRFAAARGVAAFADLPRWFATSTSAAEAAGLAVGPADQHGGALETSQALELFGELVGDFSSVVGFTDANGEWEQRLWSEGIGALSPLGVMGDARRANAAAGAAINAALVRLLADWVVTCFAPGA